jgi:DNA-binding transcriptional LysR family regulator
MIQKLDFTVLSAFVAVVETGSFRGASERLSRTQSAVSVQIRRLEDRVGARLIQRYPGNVKLTVYGERLLPYAKRLVDQAMEATSALHAPELAGEIRLGVPEWFAIQRRQSVFSRFMRANPKVYLNIRVDVSSQLRDAVSTEDLDLALAIRDTEDDMRPVVHSEPLLWVVGKDQPLRIGEEMPLALFDPPCPYRAIAMRTLGQCGWSWRETFTSSSVASVTNAVRAGMGLSVFPESAVTDDLRVLGSNDGFPDLPRTELAIHKRKTAASDAHRHLTAHLAETIKEITRLPATT